MARALCVLDWDEERCFLVDTLNNEVVANAHGLHFRPRKLAIRYGQIRKHGRPWQFRKNLTRLVMRGCEWQVVFHRGSTGAGTDQIAANILASNRRV
jgi:hypothetical protein